MSDFGVEDGSVGNFDENPIHSQNQDKEFKTVQLVDGNSALYKNGNSENRDEKISMARENVEDPRKKFKLESETESEKETPGKMNKLLKTGVILTLFFLLLNFVLVGIAGKRTFYISCSCSANETAQNRENIKLELSAIKNWMNFTEEKSESHHFQIQELLNRIKKLETLENENEQLKKSQDELKEQFESLSRKMAEFKSEISSARNVSTTTEIEQERTSTAAPQSKSITSCSKALEILPSSRSQKQVIYTHGNSTSLEVLCDFETDGGGWTLIQKRTSGPKQEFNKTWAEYQNGFGSLDRNFWIGLENIHALTKNGDQELRIELEDFEGEKRYVKYSSFSVSDASDFYRLSISGFSGDAGDSMNSSSPNHVHNGMQFSTKDKDNDKHGANCAVYYGGGGWWFHSCFAANLNGLYFDKGEPGLSSPGIIWLSWKGFYYSLAKTEMKIRTRK